eukprot:Lankesteria_metandrocarpae@DN4494_c0_g1_i1.p1
MSFCGGDRESRHETSTTATKHKVTPMVCNLRYDDSKRQSSKVDLSKWETTHGNQHSPQTPYVSGGGSCYVSVKNATTNRSPADVDRNNSVTYPSRRRKNYRHHSQPNTSNFNITRNSRKNGESQLNRASTKIVNFRDDVTLWNIDTSPSTQPTTPTTAEAAAVAVADSYTTKKVYHHSATTPCIRPAPDGFIADERTTTTRASNFDNNLHFVMNFNATAGSAPLNSKAAGLIISTLQKHIRFQGIRIMCSILQASVHRRQMSTFTILRSLLFRGFPRNSKFGYHSGLSTQTTHVSSEGGPPALSESTTMSSEGFSGMHCDTLKELPSSSDWNKESICHVTATSVGGVPSSIKGFNRMSSGDIQFNGGPSNVAGNENRHGSMLYSNNRSNYIHGNSPAGTANDSTASNSSGGVNSQQPLQCAHPMQQHPPATPHVTGAIEKRVNFCTKRSLSSRRLDSSLSDENFNVPVTRAAVKNPVRRAHTALVPLLKLPKHVSPPETRRQPGQSPPMSLVFAMMSKGNTSSTSLSGLSVKRGRTGSPAPFLLNEKSSFSMRRKSSLRQMSADAPKLGSTSIRATDAPCFQYFRAASSATEDGSAKQYSSRTMHTLNGLPRSMGSQSGDTTSVWGSNATDSKASTEYSSTFGATTGQSLASDSSQAVQHNHGVDPGSRWSRRRKAKRKYATAASETAHGTTDMSPMSLEMSSCFSAEFSPGEETNSPLEYYDYTGHCTTAVDMQGGESQQPETPHGVDRYYTQDGPVYHNYREPHTNQKNNKESDTRQGGVEWQSPFKYNPISALRSYLSQNKVSSQDFTHLTAATAFPFLVSESALSSEGNSSYRTTSRRGSSVPPYLPVSSNAGTSPVMVPTPAPVNLNRSVSLRRAPLHSPPRASTTDCDRSEANVVPEYFMSALDSPYTSARSVASIAHPQNTRAATSTYTVSTNRSSVARTTAVQKTAPRHAGKPLKSSLASSAKRDTARSEISNNILADVNKRSPRIIVQTTDTPPAAAVSSATTTEETTVPLHSSNHIPPVCLERLYLGGSLELYNEWTGSSEDVQCKIIDCHLVISKRSPDMYRQTGSPALLPDDKRNRSRKPRTVARKPRNVTPTFLTPPHTATTTTTTTNTLCAVPDTSAITDAVLHPMPLLTVPQRGSSHSSAPPSDPRSARAEIMRIPIVHLLGILQTCGDIQMQTNPQNNRPCCPWRSIVLVCTGGIVRSDIENTQPSVSWASSASAVSMLDDTSSYTKCPSSNDIDKRERSYIYLCALTDADFYCWYIGLHWLVYQTAGVFLSLTALQLQRFEHKDRAYGTDTTTRSGAKVKVANAREGCAPHKGEGIVAAPSGAASEASQKIFVSAGVCHPWMIFRRMTVYTKVRMQLAHQKIDKYTHTPAS